VDVITYLNNSQEGKTGMMERQKTGLMEYWKNGNAKERKIGMMKCRIVVTLTSLGGCGIA
jgi:hypothetical protein